MEGLSLLPLGSSALGVGEEAGSYDRKKAEFLPTSPEPDSDPRNHLAPLRTVRARGSLTETTAHPGFALLSPCIQA